MNAINFNEIDVEFKFDVKDYNDIYSALIVDPKAIREVILTKESKEILAKIAEYIVEIGPRPDRITAKLSTRVSVKQDILTKINIRVNEINTFTKKHNIRATQFQAAFPDLIVKARLVIKNNGGNLQRFVPDNILPILYQFPGSGPIVPEDLRDENHYGLFNIALTKALSQGTQDVNWTIVQKSLEWVIRVEDLEEDKVKEVQKEKEKKEVKSSKKQPKDRS